MSSTSVPFPPSGHFVDAVRQSVHSAREATGIKINESACERLLLSPAFTSSFRRLAKTHGFLFPVKFDNAKQELNFLSVLSLLNFCSGYRAPLHALTGRGAFDSIRALLLALHLSSHEGTDLMSAKSMQGIHEAQVAEFMNLKIHVERPHESLPGVVIGERGGPAYDVVKLVTSAMNSTGEVLIRGGYPDLGAFVIEALKEGERVRKTGGVDAELNVIVERLVRAFPALQDMALVNGQPVYCFKKAMILVHGVHLRFGHMSPQPFPIPSTASLPIYADNVIPSMLIHLGALDLSSASLQLSDAFPNAGSAASLDALLTEAPTKEGVDKAKEAGAKAAKPTVREGPVLTQEQAFALRAGAIDVCEYLVQMAKRLYEHETKAAEELAWLGNITLPELDAWLWAVAKDRPDYRALDRFALYDTVFF